MSGAGLALARAARDLAGVRFRLHGRDPASGLDCVGLLVVALERIGRQAESPRGYGLRNVDHRGWLRLLRQPGFGPVEQNVQPGDLLFVHPGPAQVHLMIATEGGGFVHAHAGIGRVVWSPGPLAWPISSHWRLDHN